MREPTAFATFCLLISVFPIDVAIVMSRPARAENGQAVDVATFLCDDPQSAIIFRDRRDAGGEEEEAANVAGKAAGKQVCGWFSGQAVIERQVRTSSGGVEERLTAFRFLSDRRVAWIAETEFAPDSAAAGGDI